MECAICKGNPYLGMDSDYSPVANFCQHCGALLAPFDPIPAPWDLVQFASHWHNGQPSGLYSLASTDAIHFSRVGDIASDLRHLQRNANKWKVDLEILNKYLPWIERLENGVNEYKGE